MPDLWCDVDTAVIVPVNILPLMDDSDCKTIETAIVYNSAGMALTWNFMTCAGVVTGVAVTPTTGGVYDWSEPVADKGMYAIEIPASGGASANNDTEGVGWFTGVATGVLPWRGPTIGFRRAALNDLFIDGGTASTNLEDFFDGTGYAGGTVQLGANTTQIAGAAVNTALAQVGVNVVSQANIDFGALQKTSLNAATPASVVGAVGSVSGNVTGSVGSVAGNVAGNVVGSVGSVAGNVTGSVGSVAGNVTGSVGSVAGNVAGNVVGSVGSVAGNVTGSVGSVAGNVTGSVGSVAGNVTGSVGSVTGDVGGKVLGSGASVLSGTGARVVDASGNNVAPASIFTGITVLANWLQGLARKDVMNVVAKAELNAGGGSYNEATDSLEGNIDTLQPANVTQIAGAVVNTALAQVGVNVVSQANIDFGALQKTSLNAATPASVTGAVGSVSGNVTGSVGSVAGNVAGNVVGSVGSVAGNVTGSVGSVAGNVTGSVGSVAGNVTGSVGSVAGNVAGNVVGSVGSVTGNVTVGTNNDKAGYGLADDAITSAKFDEITAFPIKSADSGATLLARMSEVIESGKTFKTMVLDLWAVICGNALADDGTTPTNIKYDSPDDTVQVTHDLTVTTRTVS